MPFLEDHPRRTRCMNPQIKDMTYNTSLFSSEEYDYDAGVLNEDAFSRLKQSWPTHVSMDHSWQRKMCTMQDVFKRFPIESAARFVGVPVATTTSYDEQWLDCPSRVRFSEREIATGWKDAAFYTDDMTGSIFIMFFDKRVLTKAEALTNTIQTIVVCIILASVSMMFSNDANTLVLGPIEKIMGRVRQIAKDPLSASKISEDDFRKEQAAEDKLRQQNKGWQKLQNADSFAEKFIICIDPRFWVPVTIDFAKMIVGLKKKEEEPSETALLERTITKIGGLLGLGFGEAGGEIIAQNMRSGSSAGLRLVAGRRVDAVFGHATVGNFTEAIEVLSDSVMIFVNQVAEIVHGIVDEFGGAPNRNVGSAFLSVWRIAGLSWGGDADMYNNSAADEEPPPELVVRRKVCDIALLAFAKIATAIEKSPTLHEYSKHPALIGHMLGFRVAVSLGLHYGWAIEGAIGSEFKIDASYISPDVNICTAVEGAAVVFGVPLMMTKAFVDMCTASLRTSCRICDHVKMAGSDKPFYLYALDLDREAWEVVESKERNAKAKSESRLKKRLNCELRKRQKQADDYDAAKVFYQDPDIYSARRKYPEAFFRNYGVAFRNYDAGEWEVAREFLEMTQTMLGSLDTPSGVLLNYMAEVGDFQCPSNWKGFRYFNVEEEQNRARQLKAGMASTALHTEAHDEP